MLGESVLGMLVESVLGMLGMLGESVVGIKNS